VRRCTVLLAAWLEVSLWVLPLAFEMKAGSVLKTLGTPCQQKALRWEGIFQPS
jgi:hypothetical protein